MAKPHVIMVPFPIQGHIIPLFQLAQCLAKHGITITFVTTEITHSLITNAIPEEEATNGIRLVSVPDGLGSEERRIPGKLTESVYQTMPKKIEELIKEIDDGNMEKIKCVVYDQSIGRIQEVAEKMGIGSVAFLPAAAGNLVLGFRIPELIEDGIINAEGTPMQNKMIQFSPTMPIMSPSDFVWHKIPTVKKLIFNIMKENNKSVRSADWLICNSTYDLEPGAFTLAPQIVPVGPLLASRWLDDSAAQLSKDDLSCLEWLDQQPRGSIVYVAFGSSMVLARTQLHELAKGLELANRPFLWVVRHYGGVENNNFPEGFLERVSNQGRIISWAPQQKILSHPSIACFISHCGWNSTVESVSNGVPILCWPYFADQFINQSYICDIWKVGLKFEKNTTGNITSEEIKKRIEELLNDEVFRKRALDLKEKIWISAREGGNSYKNLWDFISWAKDQNICVKI